MVHQDKKLSVLELHTDPKWGSAYWINFFTENKLSVKDILSDPFCASSMDYEAMRSYPIEYFIPQKILSENKHLVCGETSGFSGKPVATVFSEDEFHEGFVTPFLIASEEKSFPLKSRWLWAGPSGPHIIGKAVREILRVAGGIDPFSIDFDPRWYKKIGEGSFLLERYFKHIEDQIFNILNLQNIDVIFSTPPVINMLCEKMDEAKRHRIKGVHYGGVAITYQEYMKFHEFFPNAVHLSGYGNSLFGVFIENFFDEDGIEYNIESNRVEINIVKQSSNKISPCENNEEGNVMFSRFDETFLILNLIEGDVAIKTSSGLKNPHRARKEKKVKVIY